jgi:hypothetical protein
MSSAYEEWRKAVCEGPPQDKATLALLAQRALIESLQEVARAEDQAELDDLGNLHWRCADTLMALTNYLGSINTDDNVVEVVAVFMQRLASALYDRAEGISDPLLELKRTSKRDASYTWSTRMLAVLGVEYLIEVEGLSRKDAAHRMAKKHPKLARLKRGERRDLVGSILSWRERLLDGRVPPSVRRDFRIEHQIFTRCFGDKVFRDTWKAKFGDYKGEALDEALDNFLSLGGK